MKQLLCLLAVAVALALPMLSTGCISTPHRDAYQVEIQIMPSVQKAKTEWFALLVSGKISVEQESSFIAIYNRYLEAQRLMQSLVTTHQNGQTVADATWKSAITSLKAASDEVVKYVESVKPKAAP